MGASLQAITSTEEGGTNVSSSIRSEMNEQSEDAAGNKDNNILREIPYRYLGYANEVGESFRYQFPRLVMPTYVVAFVYCFADAALTGYRQWEKLDKAKDIRTTNLAQKNASLKGGEFRTNTLTSNEIRAALTVADTLLWQSKCRR
jgi:hypothetical protein